MPHGLTIDHEGNTWLTDVAMHQVSTFTSGRVDRSTKTGQYGFELILLRPISSHALTENGGKKRKSHKIRNLHGHNLFFECKPFF